MAKEYLKIWFDDIEDAQEFFDGNQKHLGEFMVNVYRSYAELPTNFTCKLVEKYFKTYLKRIEYIKNSKQFGKDGGFKKHDNQEVTEDTLVGSVVGSVVGMVVAKDKSKKIKDKYEILNKEINIDSEIEFIYELYPPTCYTKGSSTGKSTKNKEKIRSIIKQNGYEWLRLRIESYLVSCKQNKIYLKNFTTFLNNIPEPIENKKTEINLGQIKYRWKTDPSHIERIIDKNKSKEYFDRQLEGGYIAIIL